MAKKTTKTAKAQKAGPKSKQAPAKSVPKKKIVKTKPVKAKKSAASNRKRVAVKVSKPKRKPIASRKAPVASTVSRSRAIAKPKPEMTNEQANNPNTGMMGDGTEEQNLNQQGNPGARINQDEVDEAFKK